MLDPAVHRDSADIENLHQLMCGIALAFFHWFAARLDSFRDRFSRLRCRSFHCCFHLIVPVFDVTAVFYFPNRIVQQ